MATATNIAFEGKQPNEDVSLFLHIFSESKRRKTFFNNSESHKITLFAKFLHRIPSSFSEAFSGHIKQKNEFWTLHACPTNDAKIRHDENCTSQELFFKNSSKKSLVKEKTNRFFTRQNYLSGMNFPLQMLVSYCHFSRCIIFSLCKRIWFAEYLFEKCRFLGRKKFTFWR